MLRAEVGVHVQKENAHFEILVRVSELFFQQRALLVHMLQRESVLLNLRVHCRQVHVRARDALPVLEIRHAIVRVRFFSDEGAAE